MTRGGPLPNPSPHPNPNPDPNQDLAQWEDAIDLHEVRSNDVHAVLMRYGVEVRSILALTLALTRRRTIA